MSDLNDLQLGPGQALVAPQAAAVEPADQLLSGRPTAFNGIAGRVLALGRQVHHLRRGQDVWGYGARVPLQPRCLISASFLAPRPLVLNELQAAALAAPALAAMECFQRVTHRKSVLITGAADPTGALLLQMYRGSQVLVTSGSPRSHQRLRELGLSEEQILDYHGQRLDELEETVRQRTAGLGVEVAFDLVGHRLRQLCCRSVRVGGAIVSLQQEPHDQPDWRDTPLGSRSISVHSVYLPAHALSCDPRLWTHYSLQLQEVGRLFDRHMLMAPRIADLGTLSQDDWSCCHDLWEQRDRLGPLAARLEPWVEPELGIF